MNLHVARVPELESIWFPDHTRISFPVVDASGFEPEGWPIEIGLAWLDRDAGVQS